MTKVERKVEGEALLQRAAKVQRNTTVERRLEREVEGEAQLQRVANVVVSAPRWDGCRQSSDPEIANSDCNGNTTVLLVARPGRGSTSATWYVQFL